MSNIRIGESGLLEAIDADGVWQAIPKGAVDEILELRRQLGGGCDANEGRLHKVMIQGSYKFCADCGESLRGTRYCHEPPSVG